MPRSLLKATISPPSTSILALHPLPSIPPYTLALALLPTPTGTVLSHINLAGDNLDAVGEEVILGDLWFAGAVDLVVSQSVERGGMGLVALVGEEVGAMLVVAPSLKSGFRFAACGIP